MTLHPIQQAPETLNPQDISDATGLSLEDADKVLKVVKSKLSEIGEQAIVIPKSKATPRCSILLYPNHKFVIREVKEMVNSKPKSIVKGEGQYKKIYRAFKFFLFNKKWKRVADVVIKKNIQDAKNEFNLMRSLTKKNQNKSLIAKIYKCFATYTSPKSGATRIRYTMQLYDYSLDSLEKHMQDVPENQHMSLKVKIAKKMAESLKSVHDVDYFHGDIKPENFFFTKLNPCLADFGLSAQINNPGKTIKGTPLYYAPELALRHVSEYQLLWFKARNSAESDIWALAVTYCYLFFYAKIPIEKWTPEYLEVLFMQNKYFEKQFKALADVSQEDLDSEFDQHIKSGNEIESKIAQLLKEMMRINPCTRITANQIIEKLSQIKIPSDRERFSPHALLALKPDNDE